MSGFCSSGYSFLKDLQIKSLYHYTPGEPVSQTALPDSPASLRLKGNMCLFPEILKLTLGN